MGFITDFIGDITGSNQAAEGAQNAAATQAAAAKQGIAEQRRQFDALGRLLSPYSSAATGGAASPTQAIIGYYQKYMGKTPKAETLAEWMRDISTGKRTLADAERIISSGGGAQEYALAGNLAPAPQGSLSAQQDILGLSGNAAQQAAIGRIESSPMFGSIYQQGENAILQNASATGGLRGGNVQGALARFRPALLQSLIDQQYSRLSGITALGQNSAAGTGVAGMETGRSVADLLGQSAAATAGGQIAAGNARSNTFGNLVSLGGAIYGGGGF